MVRKQTYRGASCQLAGCGMLSGNTRLTSANTTPDTRVRVRRIASMMLRHTA